MHRGGNCKIPHRKEARDTMYVENMQKTRVCVCVWSHLEQLVVCDAAHSLLSHPLCEAPLLDRSVRRHAWQACWEAAIEQCVEGGQERVHTLIQGAI